MKNCLLSMLLILCLLIPLAEADERILSFHSDITVHEDAGMTVKETITVRVEGIKIKRGMCLDFN